MIFKLLFSIFWSIYWILCSKRETLSEYSFDSYNLSWIYLSSDSFLNFKELISFNFYDMPTSSSIFSWFLNFSISLVWLVSSSRCLVWISLISCLRFYFCYFSLLISAFKFVFYSVRLWIVVFRASSSFFRIVSTDLMF